MRDTLKKRILSIDDDSSILEAISCVLEIDGYEILSAKNGRMALDLLKSLSDSDLPDLILLDYEMPILNGEEFNRERMLDVRLSKIPVVLMTAASDLHKIMDKMDVEAYLNKPMGVDSILQVAHNFIDRRDAARYSFLT